MSSYVIRLFLVKLYYHEPNLFRFIVEILGNKIEWVELDPGALTLTPQQRYWPFIVYLSVIYNIPDDFEHPKEGYDFKSDGCYIEDGSAGAWEGSGYGSMTKIEVGPNDVDEILICEDDDEIKFLAVPINFIKMASSSYSHCSCYGAVTACDLSDSDYCDLTPAEIEEFITDADYPRSTLGGELVQTTDQYELASSESRRDAFEELCATRLGFSFDSGDLEYHFVESLKILSSM